MQYGASGHYQTEKGKEYFAYQQSFREGAVLEARKFAAYIDPKDKVLDFGCGGGWVLRQINCSKRIGIELNEAAHPYCRDNGIDVYRDAAEVPHSDFDVVISNHCLEHVPFPIEALRAVTRLLRPDGKLVLVVPLDDWRVQHDSTGKDIDHHLHTWTPRLLANTLVEAGLVVDKVDVLSHAWPPKWAVLMRILPRGVFDGLCWVTAVLKKRRQLIAICRKLG